MPTVQRYGGLKVDTAPLPGARKTAAETPTSTGAGLAEAQGQTAIAAANVGEGIARTGLQLGAEQIAARERAQKEADAVAIMAAKNQLARWETDRLYDPQKGALTVKGKDAMALPEQLDGEFQTLTGSIEQGLNPRQREAFQGVKNDAGQNIHATILRHVFSEMQTYKTSELNARIDNGKNLAIANATDPRRVGVELNSILADLHANGPGLGMGAAQIEEATKKITTAVHVGVIDRLLTNEQAKAAQVYFEETKGQISGDAMDRVEKALEEGKLRGDSQHQADAIIQAGGTLSEQREKVKAITDPKLRDEVQQRVEHEANVQEKIKRDAEEATLGAAYSLVDQHHDVAAIPPATWAALPGASRSALRSYAEHLAKGEPVATDPPTYYGLMTQAAEKPNDFLAVNLLNAKAKLDEADFKQLVELQSSIRKGDRVKAEALTTGFRTTSQIVTDSLTNYGIETAAAKQSTAQKETIAQLHRMLDTRVQAQEHLTGKKPTNDDIQRTLDSLLSQSAKTPGSFWNLWQGGTKPLLNLTISDVPALDRTQIEAALKRAGRPVSDATVLDLYLEHQTRTKK